MDLTPEEMTEILRGLNQQMWKWDHIGARAEKKRAANRSARIKLLEDGAIEAPPGWYVSGHPEWDEAKRVLAEREA